MEAVLEDASIDPDQPGQDLHLADLLPPARGMKTGKPLAHRRDVEGEALSTWSSKLRGNFNRGRRQGPGLVTAAAMLQDLAILTGGQVISGEVGLKLDQTGRPARSGPSHRRDQGQHHGRPRGAGFARHRSPAGSQIKASKSTKTDSDWDREKLQERSPSFAGGVCRDQGRRHRGGAEEKKHRIEDAISATRAAIEEGIVAGGGTASSALPALDDLGLTGDEAHRRQHRTQRPRPSPLRWIAENAGLEGLCRRLLKVADLPIGQGLNAATGAYVDGRRRRARPGRVTRSALRNAASIASMVPTTDAPGGREEGSSRGRSRHGHDPTIFAAGTCRAASRTAPTHPCVGGRRRRPAVRVLFLLARTDAAIATG